MNTFVTLFKTVDGVYQPSIETLNSISEAFSNVKRLSNDSIVFDSENNESDVQHLFRHSVDYLDKGVSWVSPVDISDEKFERQKRWATDEIISLIEFAQKAS